MPHNSTNTDASNADVPGEHWTREVAPARGCMLYKPLSVVQQQQDFSVFSISPEELQVHYSQLIFPA